MLFAGGTQGIALDSENLCLKVVDVAAREDGTPDWQAAGVIVHDVTNRSIAHMLVELPFGPFPMALGVLYDDPRPTFETSVADERARSEEHTSELQSLMRISYAVFCLQKKHKTNTNRNQHK